MKTFFTSKFIVHLFSKNSSNHLLVFFWNSVIIFATEYLFSLVPYRRKLAGNAGEYRQRLALTRDDRNPRGFEMSPCESAKQLNSLQITCRPIFNGSFLGPVRNGPICV